MKKTREMLVSGYLLGQPRTAFDLYGQDGG